LVDKRKRSDDEGFTQSSSDDDDETVRTRTPVVEIPEKEMEYNVSDPPSDNETLDESQEFSSDTCQPTSSTMQRLVDITEEEYESAEDSDYEVGFKLLKIVRT